MPPSCAQATERRRKLDAAGGGFSLLSWMSRCLPEVPTLNRMMPLSYRLPHPEVVAALLVHSVAEVNAPDAWLVRPLEYAFYMLSDFEYFECDVVCMSACLYLFQFSASILFLHV